MSSANDGELPPATPNDSSNAADTPRDRAAAFMWAAAEFAKRRDALLRDAGAIVCGKCRAVNPAGAKVCGACREPLSVER